GYAADDILVTTISEADTSHRLAGQVRLTIAFTPGDEPFSSALQACWQDFGNNQLIDADRDKLAVITGPLPALFGKHIQPVLNWARTSSSDVEFLSKVS